MAEVIRDVATGDAKPTYNYLDNMPELAGAVRPILPRKVVTRTAIQYSSFDAGRGCPFQCSFCTIINVQGRKSRYRTADDVEAIVRANAAQGITRFFVTDDNFARNRNWESGGIEARIGLRMMPTFPRSSRSFRTAGFPQYGWKAGISGGTFPKASISLSLLPACADRRLVCLRPSCMS